MEGEGLAAEEEPGDERGAEDLPGLRQVTELPRHDDRRPEVVRLLSQRFAHVETDANLQTLAGYRLLRRLLHHNRAANGVRRRWEGDHQPIAQPLQFVTAVGGDRFLQHLMVRPEDALRALVAGALEQRR